MDDYTAFNDVWDKPDGGMHRYLFRFLSSSDPTFQHIAVWTLAQLQESHDPQLLSNIRNSPLLVPHIRQLAQSRPTSPSSSHGSPRSHRSGHSYQETDQGEGQGEIQLLSRRILDFVDSEDGEGVNPTSVGTGSHMPGSSVADSVASSFGGVGQKVGGDDELRRSVREAFSSSGSHGH